MHYSVVPILLLIFILTLNEINSQKSPRIQYSVRNEEQNEDTSHIVTFPDLIEEENDSDGKSYHRKNNKNVPTSENVIPLELLKKIGNVANASQFFDEFIASEDMDSREIAINRFSEDNVERSVGIVAKPAGCIPASTVVPLEPLNPSRDPTIIYFPSCTRVNRCGGCCPSPLLSCQPTKTETLTLLIYKSQFTGGVKMAPRGKEIVLVDQHLACDCQCKVKESDCNHYQVYEASQCKCVCTNFDEQSKCYLESDKIWDSNNCTCRCRRPGNCTSGSYFDEHQCKCLSIPNIYGSEISRPPLFDRKKFILKPIPVDPSNETKYDSTR